MTTGTMCTHKTKKEGNRVSSMHATLKHIYILFQYMHTLCLATTHKHGPVGMLP